MGHHQVNSTILALQFLKEIPSHLSLLILLHLRELVTSMFHITQCLVTTHQGVIPVMKLCLTANNRMEDTRDTHSQDNSMGNLECNNNNNNSTKACMEDNPQLNFTHLSGAGVHQAISL